MPAHPADDHAAKLELAQQRITEHPGYIEKELIDGIVRTLGAVLMPNRDELLGLLDQAANNPDLAVELFQNVRLPTGRRQFEGAVMRALHNYVASASTLVDHTRRTMKVDQGGPLMSSSSERQPLFAIPRFRLSKGFETTFCTTRSHSSATKSIYSRMR